MNSPHLKMANDVFAMMFPAITPPINPTETPDELETAEGIVAMPPDEEATQVLLRG